MESIGTRFVAAREAKGYTLEQVARDTHIAKRFLEALETEDFSVFPGEPYLLGFMRTYSNYLGLESEETVNLYRNLRLQEQPPPIDELIAKGPSLPIGRIALIALLVIVVGGGAYWAISSGVFAGTREDGVASDQSTSAQPAPARGDVFRMTDEIVEQRFSEGDRIVIPVRDDEYPVDLKSVGDGITLAYNGSEQQIAVGKEAVLDVNGDKQSDVRVIVRSVDTMDSPATVVMRLDRGAAAAVAAAANNVVPPVEGDAVAVPSVGSTLEPSREEPTRLIATFDQREEFTVDIRFEGYALFRYQVDDEQRVEQYFQAGDTLQTSVREKFMLWVSNAASARLRVSGQDILLGSAGEVTAALLTWVTDPASGKVLLELVPVY